MYSTRTASVGLGAAVSVAYPDSGVAVLGCSSEAVIGVGAGAGSPPHAARLSARMIQPARARPIACLSLLAAAPSDCWQAVF
jgi:hypothetical protein